MADYFGAAEDLVSGVGSFLGSQSAAKGAKAAASSYANAARLAMASSNIKAAMISRDIYKTLGGIRSSVASSGLATSGSALDLMRDSARQGAIAKAVVGLQGEVDYNSFMAQSHAEEAKAQSSSAGGFLGAVGSAVSIGAALFSDDSLKQDVELVRRRGDGIGIYRFRYIGSTAVFEGAMASDVEAVRPDAIFYDQSCNLRMVDYDAIKMDLRKVA